MKLEELLNTRLKSLYRRHKKVEVILKSNKDRLDELNDNLELLNLFLEDSVYEENIRKIDTSMITDILYQYHHIENSNIEVELGTIKILLQGIYDRGLKLSLTIEQKELLKKYIDAVSSLIQDLNERKSQVIDEYKSIKEEVDSLEEDILRLEILIEKITNKEDESLLDIEDLETIKLISEDESIDAKTRKEVLIKFIEYNNDRKNGKSKVNKVDIKEVISLFDEYGIKINSTVNKYSDEVINYARLDNIREILEFMKSVGILNKFNNTDLLTICLYGNDSSVREAYESINKKDNNGIYYSVPGVWVDNIPNRKIRKKKYRGQEQREKVKVSLNASAHLISKEELDNNIDYLTSEGFVFDLDDVGARKALTTDTYRLKEAVHALKNYGIVTDENISEFKIWLLSEPQLLEKVDRYVEIGLLNGHLGHEDYANYLKKYPAKLHNTDYPIYLLLYKTKQTYPVDSYYETVASPRRGQLSGNLNGGRLGDVLSTPESIEKYTKENFVNLESEIVNYSIYDEKINSTFDAEIDEEILSLPEIQNLEANYSISDNPYVYDFDGLVISRLKVLRNYSVVRDGSNDALMASICYGSFLTSESIEKIANSINYTLGGRDGVSKKL